MTTDATFRSDGYRRLFGSLKLDSQQSGADVPTYSDDKERKILRWLAAQFENPYKWDDNDNENARVSAGYTYFAQFVIHDLVYTLQDAAASDSRKARAYWPRNFRSGRLMLDAIYGKGPFVGADPFLYCSRTVQGPRPSDGGSPAVSTGIGFLRIGGEERPARPIRDLPRTFCPFAEGAPRSDVLIADQRNDDNVIIAQVTILFHLLHNIVYAKFHQFNNDNQNIGKSFLKEKMPDGQLFVLARNAVTRIYREIIFNDLLEKLLHPTVRAMYTNGDRPKLGNGDDDDPRMPLEFSHAVARFGHFMARDFYPINAELPGTDQSIKSMLRNNSARRPGDMPLEPRWLVDWTTLFQKPGQDQPKPLMSRRLGPAMARTLVQNDHVREAEREPRENGGLVYRDLLRGHDAGLASGWQIRNQMDPRIQSLSQEKDIREALNTFMKDSNDNDYVKYVIGNIPLLLFVLLEAAVTESPGIKKGQCLGPVGSTVFADCLFNARRRTAPLIEDDEQVEAALKAVCGKPPTTMPDLIAMISSEMKWDRVRPKFW